MKNGYIFCNTESRNQCIYTVQLEAIRYTCIRGENHQTMLVDSRGRTVCTSQDRRKSWERWMGSVGNTAFVDAGGERRGELILPSWLGQFHYRVDGTKESLSMKSRLLHTWFEADCLRIDQRLAIWAGEPRAEFRFSSKLDPGVTSAIVAHLVAHYDLAHQEST